MEIFRKVWDKIKFEIRMHNMDRTWRLMGGSCFGAYPPSFYHRHTPEEVERITAEHRQKLLEMIEELKE